MNVLQDKCIACVQVRSGVHPVVSDVHAVRTLFSGPPLGIKKMYANQMVSSKKIGLLHNELHFRAAQYIDDRNVRICNIHIAGSTMWSQDYS